MIRDVSIDDAGAIAAIYNHYITETSVTFEESRVSADEMAGRIGRLGDFPWHVAEEGGELLGYAYAGPFHARAAYRFTAETTVYLRSGAEGRGIGTALYGVLLDALRARGLHVAVAGIALPNPASVALHERFGFRHVGSFREVGRKFGRWIDVGFWQLCL